MSIESSKGKNHWQRHGDLIVFPRFYYNQHQQEVESVAAKLKCTRIAVLETIDLNDFRQPRIKLIKGSDPWVTHVDNKIKYAFDVTKCMFSFGNINEKLRISRIDCRGETIVDLFCGIGYFTLPFIVHGKAERVHACDWNPDAIEALTKALEINKVADKCDIHFGDSRQVCPENIADRVNLGLIPSSRIGWLTACKALKCDSGGIFHLHENVNTVQEKNKQKKKEIWWEKGFEIVSQLISLFETIYPDKKWHVKLDDINKVKSYAPHIDHLVFDIVCRPLDKNNQPPPPPSSDSGFSEASELDL